MALYEKHSNKTRKRIVDSYIRLCCQKGISNVQLADLCEACEIYRSTFYRYFDNLDALLVFIEDDFMKKSSQIKEEASQYSEHEYDKYLYEGLLQMYYDYREFLLALLSTSGSPRFVFRYKRFLRENLIDQLGLMYTKIPLQIDLVLEYVVNGMVGTISYLLRYSIQHNLSFHNNKEVWNYFLKMQHLPRIILALTNTDQPDDVLSMLYLDKELLNRGSTDGRDQI